jgi:hypothetical protein
MKKVLLLLLMGVMLLGAKSAMADAKLSSQQGDARLIDNVDLIFMGYANKVVEYQNVLDFRLNNGAGNFGNGTGEWGGLVDGKHTDLGVIGIYVNRPFAPANYNGEPGTWTPTGASTNWDTTALLTPLFNNGAATPGSGKFQATRRITTPANKVDVFYGKATDNGNFGIGINYADQQSSGFFNSINTDDEPAPDVDRTRERWAKVLGASIGLGLKDAGPFSEVNLHAGYSMGMFQNKVLDTANGTAPIANDLVKDDGVYTITVGALAQKDLDKDTSMRMFVDAVLSSLKLKASLTHDINGTPGLHNEAGDEDYQYTTAFDNMVIALGLGCNHKVNDGAAVVSSGLVGGFNTTTWKATSTNQNGNTTVVSIDDLNTEKNDTTNINLWWNASVDAKVASWINVRAGIRSSVFNRTTTKTTNNYNIVANAYTRTATYESTVENTGTAFSCGFGIHWQNWVLNTNVTAASLEAGIASPQPGGGILFPASGGAGLLVVQEADLAYTF